MEKPTRSIEAPRRKQRGIFDPDKTCFICSLTPPQAAGNRVYELGEANALAGIQQKKKCELDLKGFEEKS